MSSARLDNTLLCKHTGALLPVDCAILATILTPKHYRSDESRFKVSGNIERPVVFMYRAYLKPNNRGLALKQFLTGTPVISAGELLYETGEIPEFQSPSR